MHKHVTIDLDMALVGEAAIALDTKRVSDTVSAALKTIVDARKRLRLLELDPNLTLQGLAADRLDDRRHPYP